MARFVSFRSHLSNDDTYLFLHAGYFARWHASSASLLRVDGENIPGSSWARLRAQHLDWDIGGEDHWVNRIWRNEAQHVCEVWLRLQTLAAWDFDLGIWPVRDSF
jgi:hypothetical protein